MKAMLLAAGRGKRMRPLTDSLPKPLLPIGELTLIERHLERLAAAGFQQVVINLRYLGQLIETHIGDGSRWGLPITWSRESQKLDTGGGIKNALPWLGDAPFALINADVYTDFDFRLLQNPLPAASLGRLVMVDNPPHNPQGDFCLEAGLLTLAQPRLTYAGIAQLHPDLVRDEPEASFPLLKAIDVAIAAKRLHGLHHQGTWCDVGTPERYNDLLDSLAPRHGQSE